MQLVTWPAYFPARGGYNTGYASAVLGSTVAAGCNVYLWHILQAINRRRNIILLNIPAAYRGGFSNGITSGDDDFQPYPDWCAKRAIGTGSGTRALVTNVPTLLNWFRLEIEKCGEFFSLVKQSLVARLDTYGDPGSEVLWTSLAKMSLASAASRATAGYGLNLLPGASAGTGTPKFGNAANAGWLINRMESAGSFADIARITDAWKEASTDVMLFWAQFVNEMMHYINTQRVLSIPEVPCNWYHGEATYLLEAYDDTPDPVKIESAARQAHALAADNLSKEPSTTSSYCWGDISVTGSYTSNQTPYQGGAVIDVYVPCDDVWKYLISQRDRADIPIYERSASFLTSAQILALASAPFSSLMSRDTNWWGLCFSADGIFRKFDPDYRDDSFSSIHFP